MSRTVTAMFNSRSEAETAATKLRNEIGAEARIVDQSSSNTSTTGSSAGSGGGFWADLKDMFVSDEDRPAYEEGVRRGHFLLTAQVPEEHADRACGMLEGGAMDFDQSQAKWRSEGWSGGSIGRTEARSNTADGERGRIVEEERIPIVEEQLRVGKREVERGGARVRSYVEERPVSEQVNLREEHVEIERRPVDQTLSAANLSDSDLLRERTVEMRERGEEAVVDKTARVTEEVVVKKTADERVEKVEDTVRSTHVDVDEGVSERGSSSFDDNGRR